MMDILSMQLVHFSFIASIMILIAIIVRKLGVQIISKFTLLFVWLLICIRLLLPVHFQMGFRLDRVFFQESVGAPALPVEPIPASIERDIQQEIVMQDVIDIELDSITYHGFSFQIRHLWLAGAGLLGLYLIVTNQRFKKEISDAFPIENPFIIQWLGQHPLKRNISIKVSDKITSPLTYGVLKPVILLPKGINKLNETQLRYILAHEYMHIRRFDCLFKGMLTLSLCLHWFNPFVWLMYILANRDIELSCDEAVLTGLDEAEISNYALTLIVMAEHQMRPTLIHSYFSQNGIEERIKVMMMKKKSKIASIVAVLLVGSAMMVFATGNEPTTPVVNLEDIDVEAVMNAERTGEFGHIIEVEGLLAVVVTEKNYETYSTWLEQELERYPNWYMQYDSEEGSRAGDWVLEPLDALRDGARYFVLGSENGNNFFNRPSLMTPGPGGQYNNINFSLYHFAFHGFPDTRPFVSSRDLFLDEDSNGNWVWLYNNRQIDDISELGAMVIEGINPGEFIIISTGEESSASPPQWDESTVTYFSEAEAGVCNFSFMSDGEGVSGFGFGTEQGSLIEVIVNETGEDKGLSVYIDGIKVDPSVANLQMTVGENGEVQGTLNCEE